MTEIKFDKRNYRKHGEKNKNLINKSLVECGAGRSILVDNNNEIIAGNGVYEQAQALGIKTRVVETKGDELVVVKRLDINSDDEKRKKLAVLDNSTSDSSEFDMELLASDFDNIDLVDLGIDVDVSEALEDETYTNVVNIPQYQVEGEDVAIYDLVEKDKVKSLLDEIEAASIDADIKEFLRIAAYRHYIFNYRKIAEFYAKADKKVLRKCMNSFFCSVEKKFTFLGRVNEDVNTYTRLGQIGDLFFTYVPCSLNQKQTQSNKGGMSDLYLDSGTYVKSFYSVIFSPSCVSIAMMGDKHKRIHHNISWDNCVPKILNEKYKIK